MHSTPLAIPNFHLYNTGGHCLVHRKDNADGTTWILAQEDGETLCDNETIVLASLFNGSFEYLGISMTFKNIEEAVKYFGTMPNGDQQCTLCGKHSYKTKKSNIFNGICPHCGKQGYLRKIEEE